MSYASLLAAAVSYWPSQEASGNLTDIVASVQFLPSGAPSYANVGPAAWLPFGVGLDVASSFGSAGYAGMTGAVAYTFAGWYRVPVSSTGLDVAFAQTGAFPWCGFDTGGQMFTINNGSGAVSGPPIWSTSAWEFVSWRRSVSGLVARYGRGTVFADAVTQNNPWQGGLISLGSPLGFLHTFAGLGLWSSFLSDADIADLIVGPVVPVPFVGRRSRGSGKVGRPRR